MKKPFLVQSLKALFALCLFVFLFNGCEKEINDVTVDTEIVPRSKGEAFNHVPNQVLIKFKDDVSEDVRSQALSRISATVEKNIFTRSMRNANIKSGILLVRTPMQALEAIDQLKGGAEIEFIEPNYVYQHFSSNDPFYTSGQLWGMNPSNQYGSQAGTAWAGGNTGSSSVWIGIIDEGYMYTHEDLADNAGVNPGEIAGNGVDDDGNGYVDDVYGWDFDGNDDSVFDGVDDDHGTHVAGTIGGVGNNGTGVAGVSWDVSLIGAKFLGRRGGTTANAVEAVDYLTDLKVNGGLNIVASNNSWGGGGYSTALYNAISRANDAGILFIAAAGNSSNNNDASPSYPSSYDLPNVIAVASITSSGAMSSFSSYGATSVDLGAPGSAIISTVPARSKGNVVSAYASYSGTSMATPHVSGAAALYAASNPSASAAQIKAAILSSVVPTPSLSGKTLTGGRLNVSGF